MKEDRWKLLKVSVLAVASAAFIAASAYGQQFTVSATPNTLTIHPGDQNVPVTVAVNSGDNDSDDYTGPVVVTMTGLPSGITATPVTLTPGSSGTLLLSASPSAGQEGFPTSSATTSTAWAATTTLVGMSGTQIANSSFVLTVSISNTSFSPKPGDINLPIVQIDTNNVPIADKTTKVPGTITITSADGQTSYLPNSSDSDNTATFHLHGNSTLYMPKQAYTVKLNTSLDLLNTMGVNCGYVTSSGKATCDKSKSYVLLANYDDKTLLRDWSASALANAIPYGGDYLDETLIPSGDTGTIPSPSGTSANMPWAPHSLFVELFVNGVYEGNYQLIEKLNVDSHRVNINELSESDTDPSQVTGGYLLEIDAHADEAYTFWSSYINNSIGLEDPDFSPDPEVPAQTTYITNYVNAAEAALFSSSFTDPTLGWRAYFDEASAINFYIVNDVMGNVDGGDFFSSVYLYKDQNNPFLYMGPIWDFDISSGNVNYEPIVNPTVTWMQGYSPWYKQWFTDPGFKADVVKQWNTLKSNGVFDNWIASIQAQATKMEQTQTNNNARWPMQGIRVWPNAEAVGSYDDEVNYLVEWLRLRIAYMDSLFNNKAATTTTLTVPSGTLRAGTAATFSARVTGGNSPAGSVTFLENGIPFGTAPLAGSSASLTTTFLQAGNDALMAVYSGDENNALSASDPQTETVASPLIASTTSLAAASTQGSFSVSVIGESGGGIPTGTVTLMNGTTALGTATLAADGSATISVSLPVGSDSITAVYNGDATFQSSTSNAIAATVVAPDFSFTSSSTSAQVTSTGSSSLTLTVAPENGFNQAVSFSCGTTPAGLSCLFSPASVTPSGNSVTSTLTFSLASGNSKVELPVWSRVGGGVLVCLLFWPFRRRRLRTIFALGIVLAVGFSITACGSFSPGQPKTTTYPVTVTATSGGLSHSVSIDVTASR